MKNRFVLNVLVAVSVMLGLSSTLPLRAQEAGRSPDDAATTTLPDGTQVLKLDDQTVVIEFANSLRFTLSTQDKLTVQGENNDPVEMTRSAMQPGAMSDGTVVLPLSDGSLEITLPDGAMIKVSAENEVDVTEPTLSLIPRAQTAMNCTFTATRSANLRSGAGVTFERTGTLEVGEQMQVIGQQTGKDGYIWWQGQNNQWVRSNLGTSNCPAVCGNDVCESGETSSSCAQDCRGNGTTSTNTNTTTTTNNNTNTGEGCLVNSCESCYQSVSCYPTCNQCTCSKNAFGCITCFCTTPTNTNTDDGDSTGNGCKFATCEACIAAFPCTPAVCTKKECSLNANGCPVCSTGP